MKIVRSAPMGVLLFAMMAGSAPAAPPNTEAVEFYNTTLDHYFVTADAGEALGIDAGAAGPGWVRTGRSFQAWGDAGSGPPDAQPVCRFYSSGANSHFYTASAGECAALRAQEALERNAGNGVRGWAYEGISFYIQAPETNPACPALTTALQRVYNNGFANGQGSNHRFVDDAQLLELMAQRGWVVEGAVMCAQDKAAGGSANLPPTTTNFESIAGTYDGDARWKSQSTGMETRTTQPLSLTIAADGVVTGSGYGCAFTGDVVFGDGFRSLFKAEVSAIGCTVASFDGGYLFAHFERHGSGTLRVLMKRNAGPVEAMIDASLTSGDATPEPPTPPTSPPTRPSVAGTWTGTVAWRAQQNSRGSPHAGINVNQVLNLTIAEDGTLTGSGFGCTFTGTMTRTANSSSHYTGDVEASGCTEAVFNGTFSQASVTVEGNGQLQVHLGRQTHGSAGQSEVKVQGALQAAAP